VTNKLPPDGPDDLRERIQKLISFRDKRERAWKPEEAVSVHGSLKSRYRKVLTCSFASGDGPVPARGTMAAQAEQNCPGCRDHARK
jgi:hypothetical protein